MARGFFWKMAREGWAGRLAGAPEGGGAWWGVGCGGVCDGRASGPREREAQWVGRSRLRVRELIPPAALARGAFE